MAKPKKTALAPVSNGAASQIESTEPYVARVTVQGSAPLLFHNYNVESVAEKGKAAKGSTQKKFDDLESYVYRVSDDDRRLGVPGMNFCSSLAIAAKSMQDPRSPRKSMMDLVKASVIPLDTVAPFVPDVTEWDYVDTRRVVVQRAAISRQRPAMNKGWRITFALAIQAPEYIPSDVLQQLVQRAGMFQGLGDFRPTFGRFFVVHFEVGNLDLDAAA